MIKIIFKSILNRKLSFFLTVFSIAISIALFVGVERVRLGAKQSFSNTISNADLIVGARGSALQLLLYTVFHIGTASNNIDWKSYQKIAQREDVAWTIPFSMGDSYRGYRVLATDNNFYEHFQFHENKKPEFKSGSAPKLLFDIVIGSTVEEKQKLKIGDKIPLTHGVTQAGGIEHSNKPFTIVGILNNTGTPIDTSLYMTLEGDEAMHIDWHDGSSPLPGKSIAGDLLKKEDIKIEDITSFLVGAKSRVQTLSLQRDINNFKAEPLMAIIPGVTLSSLWKSMSYVEIALKIVTIAVITVGLIGMMVSILNSLEGRKNEIAILRAIGSSRQRIFIILIAECFLLSLAGCMVGVVLSYFILMLAKPLILSSFGLNIPLIFLKYYEYFYLFIVVVISSLLGFIPGYQAYKNSLHNGLK